MARPSSAKAPGWATAGRVAKRDASLACQGLARGARLTHTSRVQTDLAGAEEPKAHGARNELIGLCAYWFVMTASLGVYLPYFSLYLSEGLGFSGAQVGITFAVPPLVGMLAQPLWGQVGDRTGSRTLVLAFLSFGTALGYLVLSLPHRFPTMLAATALLSFFSTSQIPLAVAVTMSGLRRAGSVSFGRVRVFGTVGFLMTVLIVPKLLALLSAGDGADQSHQSQHFDGTFYLAGGLALCASLIALCLPRVTGAAVARASRTDYKLLLRNPAYLRVISVSFASYFFLQGPMVLFPVFVRSRGGDARAISHMWLWMLVLETVLLFVATDVYRKLGARRAVMLGIVASGVRFTLCALCYDLRLLYPVQALHGIMVFSLQVAAPMWIETLVPERLRGTSQAGLNMLGPSIGGIVSSTLAGALLDARDIDTVFLCGGLGALVLACALPWILPSQDPAAATPT
jgi:PPP family 3-phenylpropionic acid transporter